MSSLINIVSLDNVVFRSYTVLKKSGKSRRVFEARPEDNAGCFGAYILHKDTVNRVVRNTVPRDIIRRTAYNKGVSIPDIIQNLKGSKVFLQVDIEDFFNVCPITEPFIKELVPRNYYYDVINKVGIKQGTNISGDITNLAMLEFDKKMLTYTNKYIRYADDIFLGCESVEEAEHLLEIVTNMIEAMGMKLNKRKTVITDLTNPDDRYVKCLGYSIKRDKQDLNKLRVTISRKKRHKWWAKSQHKHACSKLESEVNEEWFSL